MQLKIYKYIIGGYGALLLVSLALFYLLPKEDLSDSFPGTAGAEEDAIYYEEQWAGEPEEMEGIYRYKQWHLDYGGGPLTILPGDSSGQVLITIKRRAAESGEITAVEYRREGFPCEDRLIPFRVSLTGNRLTVHAPERYEFKFRAFVRDWPVDQFRDRSGLQLSMPRFHDFRFFQELYLYIPAGVEIEYDPESIFLIFADEE